MSLQMGVGMGTVCVCVGAAAATASKLVQSSYLVSARPLSLSAILSLHLTLQLWTVVTLWEFVAMQRNCCDQEKEKLFKQRKLLKIIADPRVVTAATLPYPTPCTARAHKAPCESAPSLQIASDLENKFPHANGNCFLSRKL